MERIVLDTVTVSGNIVSYRFTVSDALRKYFQTDTMVVEYEESMQDTPLSILTIPFVSCVAGLSWLTGSVLFVDEIDATFYEAYKNIKAAYAELHGVASFGGMLVPSRFVKNTVSPKGEAGSIMLYGGGVDGMTSTIRHQKEIKYLCNIYGWLKNMGDRVAVDESDKVNTAAFANLMGMDALHVRCNFASMFNLAVIDGKYSKRIHASYWYGLLHSMAFISITIPLAYNHGLSQIIIASSFTKGRTDVHCASYITTDSQFRFADNGTVLHDAFELSRQDKVRFLIDYHKQTVKPMNVQACSFNDHNCCECEKCFRTIAEIIAEGADPNEYGFEVEGSYTEHFKRVLKRDLSQWAPWHENYYYELARERMRANYDSLADREFADWFLNFDFTKGKRKALAVYYSRNFFKILKRKLLRR